MSGLTSYLKLHVKPSVIEYFGLYQLDDVQHGQRSDILVITRLD